MGKRKRNREFLAGMALIICCVCGAMFFYFNKDVHYKTDYLGNGATFFQVPGLYLIIEKDNNSVFEILENKLLEQYPLYLCSVRETREKQYGESGLLADMILAEGKEEIPPEDIEEPEEEGNIEEETGKNEPEIPPWEGDLVADEESMYPLSSIKDYEIALDTFYQVDSTTLFGEDLLKVEEFLKKDMTISSDGEGPKILIYHTHSQEGYAGSGHTVVDVGTVLTTLLQEKYGLSVLHHMGEYDVESRDAAYSNALPDLIQILEQYPSIEVVIDLHRDGVREDVHLVTTIDGKATAKIMFFNGVSQTRKNGKIEYLDNPNLEDNLAFSFQMQLAARTYYPSLTRDIYIKGYRYNLHLMPKSLLVEVGAQTNTYEEACNAMVYLAELLYRVLTTKR